MSGAEQQQRKDESAPSYVASGFSRITRTGP